MKLIVVSGLSGAGKSVALNTLEDIGCYCVDNLPVGLFEAFARQLMDRPHPSQDRAAVGIDARNRPADLGHVPDILQALKRQGMAVEVLFLQADDEVLLKRFSETRRRHPLSRDDRPLIDAIREERALLEPLATAADLLLDTSTSTIHQLRERIRTRFQAGTEGGLSLLFESFGYKYGVPPDADFVFDLRCLPNPYWDPRLRPLTGLDAEVAAFLESQATVTAMFGQIRDLLAHWLPCFEQENRSYLTVALGCTGGQHRSVYLADRLARHFGRHYPRVLTRHRELA